MTKKKEVPQQAKSSIKKSWWIATGVAILFLLGLALWVRNQKNEEIKECVEKGVVNNYVCKIVGANPDEDVLALQCLTR